MQMGPETCTAAVGVVISKHGRQSGQRRDVQARPLDPGEELQRRLEVLLQNLNQTQSSRRLFSVLMRCDRLEVSLKNFVSLHTVTHLPLVRQRDYSSDLGHGGGSS